MVSNPILIKTNNRQGKIPFHFQKKKYLETHSEVNKAQVEQKEKILGKRRRKDKETETEERIKEKTRNLDFTIKTESLDKETLNLEVVW